MLDIVLKWEVTIKAASYQKATASEWYMLREYLNQSVCILRYNRARDIADKSVGTLYKAAIDVLLSTPIVHIKQVQSF